MQQPSCKLTVTLDNLVHAPSASAAQLVYYRSEQMSRYIFVPLAQPAEVISQLPTANLPALLQPTFSREEQPASSMQRSREEASHITIVLVTSRRITNYSAGMRMYPGSASSPSKYVPIRGQLPSTTASIVDPEHLPKIICLCAHELIVDICRDCIMDLT
jgi:hypothetical protein